MTKALIAADGSDFAIAAARRATELLDRSTQLTVLTVVPPPVVPAAAPVTGLETVGPLATPEATVELDAALTDEGQHALERTSAALPGDVQRQLVHGEPGAEICRVADEGGFDVML